MPSGVKLQMPIYDGVGILRATASSCNIRQAEALCLFSSDQQFDDRLI